MELTISSDDQDFNESFGRMALEALIHDSDMMRCELEALRKAARAVTQFYPIGPEVKGVWMQVRKEDYDALVEALGEEAP